MSEEKKGHRLFCFGAHPDDCEMQASGLAALWTGAGGAARFVSMTDGSSGHQELGGAKLAQMRRAEALSGAAAVGADSAVLDNHDGELLPTLENRHKVIRTIREFQPDLVVCHRINDYHPDHRYTGVIVQDACYMVMVPNVLPNAPVPDREPVVIFMSDKFKKPNPFQADLVFDLDPVIEKKLDSITFTRLRCCNGCPGSIVTPKNFRKAQTSGASTCAPEQGRGLAQRRTASVPSWSPSTGRLVVQASAMPRPSRCPSTVRPLPRSYPVCSSRSDVIAASAATAPPDTWGSHSGASLAAETRLCVDVCSWTRTLADSNPTQRGPASPPSGRELGSGRR